jgi:hypothetical protein
VTAKNSSQWSVRKLRRCKIQHRRFLKILKMKQRHAIIDALCCDGHDAALKLMFHEMLLSVNLGLYRGQSRLLYVGDGRDTATVHAMKDRSPRSFLGLSWELLECGTDTVRCEQVSGF